MKFCSNCAHPLTFAHIAGDHHQRYLCNGCGAVHYANAKVLVACIAYFEDRLLMCRRARAPDLGLWEVPSGYMEEGESLEQAVTREVAEETGVRLALDKIELYAILSLPKMSQIHVVFRTELLQLPALHAGAECLDVALKRQGEIPPNEWAFGGGVCGIPANLFQEIGSRRFNIHLRSIANGASPGAVERAYPLLDPIGR